MNKKILFSLVAALSSGTALAADLPSRAVAPLAPVVVVVPSWQGFYVGGHIGGVNTQDKWTFENLGAGVWSLPGGRVNFNNTAFLGGVQGGYNWQFGSVVAGLDVSGSFSDASRSRLSPFIGTDRFSMKNRWMALGQARLGYAMGEWLVFAQGGLALGEHKMGLTTRAIGFRNDTASETRVGWTIGAGVHYRVAQNWIVGAEYNYVDFGSKTYGLTANGTPADRVKSELKSHVGKFIVNYQF